MKSSSIAFSLGLMIGLAGVAHAQLAVPTFSFTDLDGNVFRSEQLDDNRSALIIYFDPWCEHCHQQAEWISALQEGFRDVQVLFITFEPEQEPIRDFRQRHFSGSGWDNVTFLQDLDFQFETYFGYTDDPLYIYCFQPNGSEGKYFGEEQRVEVLLNYL